MYHVPISNDLRKTVAIPLGLVICPLAEQHPDEQGSLSYLSYFPFFFIN